MASQNVSQALGRAGGTGCSVETLRSGFRANSGRYVNYGCGMHAPVEWLNFDASFTLRFERIPLLGKIYTKNRTRFPSNVLYGDISKGLPLPPGSCSGIYASHMLHHLTLEQFHVALDHTFNLLAPGGVFRLVVPDLEQIAQSYLRRTREGLKGGSEYFLLATALGHKRRGKGLIAFLHEWLRTSNAMWMWDKISLIEALEQHGFSDAHACKFNDCLDPMFLHVEEKFRFDGNVAIQASKRYIPENSVNVRDK